MEPIFEAVLAGDVGAIATILDGSPGAIAAIKDVDELVLQIPHWLYRGDTPLHLAAAGLLLEALKALLDLGAPVDPVNRRGAAPLHYACDPRPSSGRPWSPEAQREVIGRLIGAGAVVDRPDRGGVTALHRAVRARSVVAVDSLLAAGANPQARTRDRGSTPLHMVVTSTGAGGTAGTSAQQIEIARLLLNFGASLSDLDDARESVADKLRHGPLRDALT